MTIDIKAQLVLLRELQEIDIHLRQIEEELELIPQQIEEAKSEWLQASSDLTQKAEDRAGAEKEKHGLERELDYCVEHLKERENKLYAIKTNKEYQAALKEIADGKRANREREDAILKLMEKNEQLSAEITQLSGRAADKEAEFKKEEAELERKRKELDTEKGAREAELMKLKGKVDKALLEKYDFIHARYPDPLAPVVKGICKGCNMNIPPQVYIELLKGLKAHFCPHCHRFIYAGEEKGNLAVEGAGVGGNNEA